MTVTTYSIQGRREYQEDRYFSKKIGKNRYVLAVFDGHGGAACSSYCLSRFKKMVTKSTQPVDMPNIIGKISRSWDKKCMDFMGLKESDITKEWRSALMHHPKWTEFAKAGLDSGTTFCSVYITLDKMHITTIGDSQVVWKFDNGKTGFSIAHKPSASSPNVRIKAEIKRPDIPRINGILAVGRAIGDNGLDMWGSVSRTPTVRIVPLQFKNKFSVLVGTDGVWDHNVTYPAVMRFRTAKEVVEYAYTRGSTDNITALLLCVRK